MNTDRINQWKKEQGISFEDVVAMTPNRVIGRDGGLPWHMPEDLKVFKRITTGHPIVMGRKTFDSMKRPLPNRQNIVLTRDVTWSSPGTERISSPEDLMSMELMNKRICVIGGSQIFSLFMPVTDILWVSRLHREYDGDTIFPQFEHEFPHVEKVESYDGFDLWKYSR